MIVDRLPRSGVPDVLGPDAEAEDARRECGAATGTVDAAA